MSWTPANNWFIPFLRGGLRNSGMTAVSDDGGWTPALVGQLKQFQKSKGLDQDGIPGANTWRALGPYLGPMTVLKSEAAIEAALTLRTYAYMTAIHAHGSARTDTQAWGSRHTVALLTILEKFDHWMHQSGAAALLWRYSWPDDKVPAGYPTYDGAPAPGDAKKSSYKVGELGLLPLVVAGPPLLAGGSAAAGLVAAAIVKTVGAAAAAAGACWLGVKLAQWAESAVDTAPKVEEESSTTVTIAPPPPPAPPPPSSPKQGITLRRDLWWFVKRVGQLAAMLVGVLVAGFGVVATLTTAAAPLVTAAAGAVGGLFWLALAAAAAFIVGAKRRRSGNG